MLLFKKFNRHNKNSSVNKKESIKRSNSLHRDVNKMNEKQQTGRSNESSNLKRIQRNQVKIITKTFNFFDYNSKF